MRKGRLAIAAALAPVLVAGLSLAGGHPGGHARICQEIAQRHMVAPKPLPARKLNFLLFDAAGRGCDDLVRAFLDAGASVAARDRFGNTALTIAARMGETETVLLLLDAGAVMDHRNLAGATPLMRAVGDGRRRTAKALVEAGANVNLSDNKGLTPLIIAAFNGDAHMVELLLEAGADPGAADATGKSAIVYAAGRGYPRIVARLIEAGVEPARAWGNRLTVLMWAAGHANDVPEAEGLATLEVLLEAGAPVDAVDDRGRTALMIAAERGHAAIVERLLGAGADPAVRDAEGLAAADLAANDAVRAALDLP